MKKQVLLFYTFLLLSVGCEKADWLSPEDVANIELNYQAELDGLQTSNGVLINQALDLTTRVADLTTEVETLESTVTSI